MTLYGFGEIVCSFEGQKSRVHLRLFEKDDFLDPIPQTHRTNHVHQSIFGQAVTMRVSELEDFPGTSDGGRLCRPKLSELLWLCRTRGPSPLVL